MPTHWTRSATAEAIGTFTLIFVGVLSIISGKLGGAPAHTINLTGIALAHGLAIAVMVAALGPVSGGHFNPAVTFGFVLTGKLHPLKGLLYLGSQLLGASAAAFLITLLFGAEIVALATPDLGKSVDLPAALLLEALATFFLVLVVFGTAVDRRAAKHVYPLAIGLTVTMGILAIGPLTGAALNPARAFGPALASDHWANHAIYWLGPLMGGACAAMLRYFFLDADQHDRPKQRREEIRPYRSRAA